MAEFLYVKVQFPFRPVSWNDPDNIAAGVSDTMISREDLVHDPLFFNETYAYRIFNNYWENFTDTDERLIVKTGPRTGIYVNYFFTRIGNRWYLTGKADLGKK